MRVCHSYVGNFLNDPLSNLAYTCFMKDDMPSCLDLLRYAVFVDDISIRCCKGEEDAFSCVAIIKFYFAVSRILDYNMTTKNT